MLEKLNAMRGIIKLSLESARRGVVEANCLIITEVSLKKPAAQML